jgi:hypothetical protein
MNRITQQEHRKFQENRRKPEKDREAVSGGRVRAHVDRILFS